LVAQFGKGWNGVRRSALTLRFSLQRMSACASKGIRSGSLDVIDLPG
jgi:hypothetical protein